MKKGRGVIRNEYAENVCRELRHYLALPAVEMDDKKPLMKHLLKWMKYAKKNKYDRP